MPSRKNLTPKQSRLVDIYRKTGNRVTAFKEAGYKYLDKNGLDCQWLPSRVSTAFHHPLVQARISELEAQDVKKKADRDDYAIDYFRREHLRLAQVAEEAGDLSTATRNIELCGRTAGAYNDSNRVDVTVTQAFDNNVQLELQRLARLAVSDKIESDIVARALPVVDADVVAVGGGEGALDPPGCGGGQFNSTDQDIIDIETTLDKPAVPSQDTPEEISEDG